jgi:hypothetical protein
MQKKDKRYSFVTTPLFLGIAAAILTTSSLLLSEKAGTPPSDYWIPMLTGFIDTDFFSVTVSVLISMAAAGYTAAILYMVNEKFINSGKSSATLVMLYFILLMSDSETIFFSGSSIAAPLFLWAIISTINSGNENAEIFKAGFLISTATLFDYHLVAMIPLVLYYSLVNRSFALRSFVISVISVILPYLITISVRHILFADSHLFLTMLWEDITGITTPSFNPESVAKIIILLFSAVLTYRVITSILSRLSSYKTIKYLALMRLIITSLIILSIIVFYDNIGGRFMTLLSIPGAYLINEYLFLDSTGKYRRAEFLVMLILLAVMRLSEII